VKSRGGAPPDFTKIGAWGSIQRGFGSRMDYTPYIVHLWPERGMGRLGAAHAWVAAALRVVAAGERRSCHAGAGWCVQKGSRGSRKPHAARNKVRAKLESTAGHPPWWNRASVAAGTPASGAGAPRVRHGWK